MGKSFIKEGRFKSPAHAEEDVEIDLYSTWPESEWGEWETVETTASLKQVWDVLAQHHRIIFRHSIEMDQHGAKIEHMQNKGVAEEKPAFAFSAALQGASEQLEKIESQPANKIGVLYCFMELESHFGNLEKVARSIGKTYESRMAATLKNICKIHEPVELSEDQLKYFAAGARSFISGWGDLTKEKVDYIRSSLLGQKLTWLPVTPKAEKVIEENRRKLDEGAVS